nr:ROK family protein [Rarobacter faecitabidus]
MRVGIDIGGTKTQAVALADSGEIAASVTLPTMRGEDAVLATTTSSVVALAATAGRELGEFSSIGIGIPGHVDRVGGRVRNAVNLGVRSLELGPALRERFGIPVEIDNDVTAAAAGAAHLMSLSGTVAFLNLGTGLAAGIVVDGVAWRGQAGAAGEIGHLPVDPHGLECPCGQRGCLETIASGAGLRRAWPAGGAHPGRGLVRAMESGDADARRAFEGLVSGAAGCVRILALSIDPQTIVIGGGLSRLGEPLRQALGATLREWSGTSPFIADLKLPERVQFLPENTPAAAVGAALVSRT